MSFTLSFPVLQILGPQLGILELRTISVRAAPRGCTHLHLSRLSYSDSAFYAFFFSSRQRDFGPEPADRACQSLREPPR
jgi:hypothetical protein